MAQCNRSTLLKPCKSRTALAITHPNAAGIDIGSASHFVAVPPDRCASFQALRLTSMRWLIG